MEQTRYSPNWISSTTGIVWQKASCCEHTKASPQKYHKFKRPYKWFKPFPTIKVILVKCRHRSWFFDKRRNLCERPRETPTWTCEPLAGSQHYRRVGFPWSYITTKSQPYQRRIKHGADNRRTCLYQGSKDNHRSECGSCIQSQPSVKKRAANSAGQGTMIYIDYMTL